MAIALASSAFLASSAPVALLAQPAAALVEAGRVHDIAQDQPPAAPSQNEPVAGPAEQAGEPPAENGKEEPLPVILVTASGREPLKDPLEEVNVAAFKLTQDFDAALVAPLAQAYEEDLPGPIRKGLRNFFRNLMEPVNALNFLLQFKVGKAFETVGRFAVNTTAGVGGLFDVAKKEPFNLPHRRNGFANTLGYYGVGPGPFLVLPLVGATTVRDLLGSGIDQSILPLAVGKPFNTPLYAIPAFTVNSLEFRIDFDQRLEEINQSDDPYYAMREGYLCLREADIAALKNRPPPRDCSIAAIMAGPQAADAPPPALPAGQAPGPGQPPAEEAPMEQAPEQKAMPAPAPPAIIYVSKEVVQPLPDS